MGMCGFGLTDEASGLSAKGASTTNSKSATTKASVMATTTMKAVKVQKSKEPIVGSGKSGTTGGSKKTLAVHSGRSVRPSEADTLQQDGFAVMEEVELKESEMAGDQWG